MKKIINFIWENFVALLILSYCIYDLNWLAIIGWLLHIIGTIYSNFLHKELKGALEDIDKWHSLFIESKYPKKYRK